MQAIEHGVQGYVPRARDAQQLVGAIRRALTEAATRRQQERASARVAASEALHRGAVETVDAVVVGLDANAVICFASARAHDCLGDGEPLVGRAFAPLWERSTQALRAVQRALRGETVANIEARHVRGARECTLRWTFRPLPPPLRDVASSAASVLAVGLDISAQRLLEQRSAEAQATAAMGALATSLAHEIRNPLNAASLQLELLERRARRVGDADLDAKIGGPTAIVRTELARLSSLLDDFLQLARARLPVRAVCPIGPLVEGVIALEAPIAAAAGVRLSADVPPGLTGRIDAGKIKQALLNVVRNAIEALGEGGGHVTVSAEPGADGGIALLVRDDGPGMPEQVRERALRPFFTTKPGGTGLGLPIAHKAVSQHDGTLQLLAQDQGGTTVRMDIPA